MEVASIVPIESLAYGIVVADDFEVAIRCCRQLRSLKTLPPSNLFQSSLKNAVLRVLSDIDEGSKNSATKKNTVFHFMSPKEAKNEGKLLHAKETLVSSRQRRRAVKFDADTHPLIKACFKGLRTTHAYLLELDYKEILSTSYGPDLIFLIEQAKSMIITENDNLISGINLDSAYNSFSDLNSELGPFHSPLQILQNGRKKMKWLVQSSESSASQSIKKLTQLYNSKMLSVVNDIRDNEAEVCSLLLGAFMEEQIRVPLMTTSFNVARAIEIATSAAAVGVWALFSLTFGDVKAIINAIPSQSLLVEVKDYIKGVIKHDSAIADESYAGKLQFMVQGMKSTVSCSSHYVSYSLERQLIELCKILHINETTPLEILIGKWDNLFKDNVMSLVVLEFRPLIARWLKWALMVHHLREQLACYTAVGVVGLVNSGKSSLVSSLFKVKVSFLSSLL